MCSKLLNLSETKLSSDTSLLTDATSQTKFVAVVGPTRTGKSYLLNYLTGQPGVFPVGNAGVVTSDVDIMNEAVQLGQHRVRLIDVEGFGDNSENHHYRLCVPVIASSDAVLLNIRGKLGRTDLLTLLGRFIFMHNMIHKDQIDCELNKENKAKLFPALILVMRDWQGTLSGEKYLADLMRAEPEDNADQKERNGLRKSVGKCFESIRIVTMPQPADVSALNDEHIPFDRTTEEFRAQAEALSNIVQDALSRPIRTLFGNKLGTEVSMAAILTTLATEVSKSHFSVPSTMRALHECAMREVDRMLDNFMQEAEPLPKLPCESEQLNNLLNNRNAAMSKKYAQLTANLAKDETHKKSFMQSVKKCHDEWMVENDRKLAKICQSAFDKVEMALRSAHDDSILAWDGCGKAKLQEETLCMLAAEGVLSHGNALPTCWLEYCNRIQCLWADSVDKYRQIQKMKQQLEEANRQAAETLKQMEGERDAERQREEEHKRWYSPVSPPCPSFIMCCGPFGFGGGGTGMPFWQREKVEEERKRPNTSSKSMISIRPKSRSSSSSSSHSSVSSGSSTTRSTSAHGPRSKILSPWGDPCVGKDAKGRDLYLGPRGGVYYIGPGGNREYVTKEIEKKKIKEKHNSMEERQRQTKCTPFWQRKNKEKERKRPNTSSHGSVSPSSSTTRSTSAHGHRSKSLSPWGDPCVGKDAKGRDLYRGPRGGVYYIGPGGNRDYVTKETEKKKIKEKHNSMEERQRQAKCTPFWQRKNIETERKRPITSSHDSVSPGSSLRQSPSGHGHRTKSVTHADPCVGKDAKGRDRCPGPRGDVYHIGPGENRVSKTKEIEKEKEKKKINEKHNCMGERQRQTECTAFRQCKRIENKQKRPNTSSHDSVSPGSSVRQSPSGHGHRTKSVTHTDPCVGKDAKGRNLFIGKRGGVYRKTKNGNRVYQTK